MKRGFLWGFLCVCCASILLYWNANALIGAKAKPRMKDLSFVPSGTVLRLLSMGHTNTVAKLRWIDSFSYLQYQFDKRDDTLMGNSEIGGFDRLYTSLIALDPHYKPFYEFAIAAESILDRRGNLALRCIQLGLMHRPYDVDLWRNLASHVKMMYGGKSTAALDSVLTRWADSVKEESQVLEAEMWKKNIGEYHLEGLDQLDYWCRQLTTRKPRSVLHNLAEETLRFQVDKYAKDILQKLYDNAGLAAYDIKNCLSPDAWKKTFGENPQVVDTAMILWGPFEFSDNEKAQMQEALKAGKRKLELLNPRAMLRYDPYGLPYYIEGGKVKSEGSYRLYFENYLKIINFNLSKKVKEKQRWPEDLEEALQWVRFSEGREQVPDNATLKWLDKEIVVEWLDENPPEPWPLNDWAHFWMSVQNN